MKVALPKIRHDEKGFKALVSLHGQTEGCFLDSVELDMSGTHWFDADMCAVLGALLYRLGDNLNDVSLTNIPADVKKILSKNGFLSHYGHEKVSDQYGTTVSYKRFDVEDDNEPPRVCRGLHFLRGWNNEQTQTLSPGSPGTSRAAGAGAPGGL